MNITNQMTNFYSIEPNNKMGLIHITLDRLGIFHYRKSRLLSSIFCCSYINYHGKDGVSIECDYDDIEEARFELSVAIKGNVECTIVSFSVNKGWKVSKLKWRKLKHQFDTVGDITTSSSKNGKEWRCMVIGDDKIDIDFAKNIIYTEVNNYILGNKHEQETIHNFQMYQWHYHH